MSLTVQQIEKIPKVDTHVNLRIDEAARRSINSSDGIYKLVSSYCEQAYRSNTVLVELVYTPEVYTVKMEDGLAAITNAIKEYSNNDLHINLSIQFLRDEEEQKALQRLDILKEWLRWNRKIEHIITGITLGSFWNHLSVDKYSTFLKRTKEFKSLALSINFEFSGRTIEDIMQLYKFASRNSLFYSKFIINGFGTNMYEDKIFEDEIVMSAIYDNQTPLVVSPRNTERTKIPIENQLVRIRKWMDMGHYIMINTDDYFKETNQYANFNTILEKAFINYDHDYWMRNGYRSWTKDNIVTMMMKSMSCSTNRSYNPEKLEKRYKDILNDDKF